MLWILRAAVDAWLCIFRRTYNRAVRVTRLLFGMALIALAVGAALLAWLYLPALHRQSIHEYSAPQLALAAGQGLPGAWTSRLDFPSRIVLGRDGHMQLRFSPQLSASESDATTDFYSRYRVVVEARAEIPSAGTSPSGLATRVLVPGHPVEFDWQITPLSEGMLEGRVWLYIRYVPEAGGVQIERPLSAQAVSMRSATLFGRAADQVTQVALIAIGIGILLALPHLLLLSRRKSRTGQNAASPPAEAAGR